LGLKLVKVVVHAYIGTVQVSGRPGSGSVKFVYLPAGGLVTSSSA
jgi:signal transduction histidine kinase